MLPAESSTHKCQSAGAIPTHRPQTPLIRDLNRATFYVFYLLPDTFFGKNFSRADLAGAREWNMQRNDVILGVLNFFGYQGVRSAWLVASPGHGNMVETHVKKPGMPINSRTFPRQPPGHGQVPNDPSDPQKNSVAAGGAMQGGPRTLFPAPGEGSF